MIVKVKGGWKVVSEKGKNLGGPYPNKAAAKRRLREVEYFKHAEKMATSFDLGRTLVKIAKLSNSVFHSFIKSTA